MIQLFLIGYFAINFVYGYRIVRHKVENWVNSGNYIFVGSSFVKIMMARLTFIVQVLLFVVALSGALGIVFCYNHLKEDPEYCSRKVLNIFSTILALWLAVVVYVSA